MATSLRAATISELPILTASYWGSDPTYVGDQDNQENITITLPCDRDLVDVDGISTVTMTPDSTTMHQSFEFLN